MFSDDAEDAARGSGHRDADLRGVAERSGSCRPAGGAAVTGDKGTKTEGETLAAEEAVAGLPGEIRRQREKM